MIGKFSRPQFRGDHLSERPTASDTVFTSLCDRSCRGNRAEWTRISMHEPHYTWSRRLGFGLLIYLFPDPLLQLYKLALINCGDISQQLLRSTPPPPPSQFFFFFPCGTLRRDCLIRFPSAVFCQRATPGRDKDILCKERTDSTASLRSHERVVVAKSSMSPELARCC